MEEDKQQLATEPTLEPVSDFVELEEVVEDEDDQQERETPIKESEIGIKMKEEQEKGKKKKKKKKKWKKKKNQKNEKEKEKVEETKRSKSEVSNFFTSSRSWRSHCLLEKLSNKCHSMPNF